MLANTAVISTAACSATDVGGFAGEPGVTTG